MLTMRALCNLLWLHSVAWCAGRGTFRTPFKARPHTTGERLSALASVHPPPLLPAHPKLIAPTAKTLLAGVSHLKSAYPPTTPPKPPPSVITLHHRPHQQHRQPPSLCLDHRQHTLTTKYQRQNATSTTIRNGPQDQGRPRRRRCC